MRTAMLLALGLLALSLQLGESRKLDDPSTVPFSFKGSNGYTYIKTENGHHWRIVPSDADPDNSFFFYNIDNEKTQWTDPRFPEDHEKLAIEVQEGKMIKKKNVYTFDEEGKVYQTVDVLHEQDMDTDKLFNADKKKDSGSTDKKSASGGTSSTTKTVVVIIPILLFLAGIFGRIFYLHVYYPELLFPTKTRRPRRAKQAKLKAQKARGKMSQDGKGGSSAGG